MLAIKIILILSFLIGIFYQFAQMYLNILWAKTKSETNTIIIQKSIFICLFLVSLIYIIYGKFE
jgi:hypothetical protein